MARANGKLSEKKVSDWFSGMNYERQQALLGALSAVHDKMRQQKIRALQRQIEELGGVGSVRRYKARKNGNGTGSARAAKKPSVKVKYRDPKSGETWSGRGRMARWLAAKIKAGEKPDKYLT